MTSSHPTLAPCQWFSQLAVATWIRAAKLSERDQSCDIAVAAGVPGPAASPHVYGQVFVVLGSLGWVVGRAGFFSWNPGHTDIPRDITFIEVDTAGRTREGCMAKGNQDAASQHLDALFSMGTAGGLTDAQLLERFTSRRDETGDRAFGTLVERHGPMVLRVCRAVLRESHDVQDAFQATFLVLVRRARSLWVRDSLGPWLHQVAYRTASYSRLATARRRRHERLAASSAVDSVHGPDGSDVAALLHEEVNRLPGQYRAAIVLCLIEGMTPAQAARQLHWPVGTVHSRLARGRERLRDRLTRRGLAPRSEQQLAVLSSVAARAEVPVTLVTSTVGASTRFAEAGVAAKAVAAPVAALTEGVLRMMLLARLKLATTLLLAIGFVAIGAGVLAMKGAVGDQQAEGPAVRSRPEGRPRSEASEGIAQRTAGPNEGIAKEELIDGVLSRSEEITSGRIEYHLKVEIAGRVVVDGDYRFSFQGEDWTLLDLRSNQTKVNHDGRLLTYTETPQPDGRVHRSVEIDFSASPFGNSPHPPVRAGTVWNSSTRQFVRDRASEAHLLGTENINGVDAVILEWGVAPNDKYLAFQEINNMLEGGGKLRLYVARQLSHALPRIEHVDRFGTVQDRFDYSEFMEVARGVYLPAACRLGVGQYKREYRVTKIERLNAPFSNEDFMLSIPAGTSIQDVRPKSKVTVDRDGKRTFSLRDYPFRAFKADAPYPHGFPPELLKELDRDVVKPIGR